MEFITISPYSNYLSKMKFCSNLVVVALVNCKKSKWSLTPKEVAATFLCELTLIFLIRPIEANVSPVINIQTFLPVIVVVVLRVNDLVKNIVFKSVDMLHPKPHRSR